MQMMKLGVRDFYQDGYVGRDVSFTWPYSSES